MLILPIFLPARSKVASPTSAMKLVFWQEVQQKDEVSFLFLWNNVILLILSWRCCILITNSFFFNHVVCCFGCLPAACLMKCVGKQCYTEMKVAIAFT